MSALNESIECCNLELEIAKAEEQFDKDGHIYHPTISSIDTATKLSGQLDSTHAAAKSVLHLELHDAGSGIASGPDKAGYALSAAVFKDGWPSSSARDGEINAAVLAFRQTNGDATCMLGNGVISNGYSSFIEASIQSMETVSPFAFKHALHLHAGVINDRDDEYYGYDVAKTVGVGGTALLAYSEGSGAWTWGLQCLHLGKPQLQQRVSDAALLIHEYDDPANYYSIKVVSGALHIEDSVGAFATFGTTASTNYTPTASDPTTWVVGSATILGRWMKKSSRVREVSIKATITNVGSLTGALCVSLPAASVNDNRYLKYWVGENLSTGKSVRGRILHNSSVVQIVKADNVDENIFPCVNGDIIYIAGEYETA